MNYILKIGNQALDLNGKTLMSAAQVDVNAGIMHTKGMANMLHIVRKMED